MRISDWSSDVCSSDLNGFDFTALVAHDEPRVGGRVGGKAARHLLARRIADHHGVAALEAPLDGGDPRRQQRLALLQRLEGAGVDPETADRLQTAGNPARSEEHTSELQSLMRISYAVFCLKKKTDPDTT